MTLARSLTLGILAVLLVSALFVLVPNHVSAADAVTTISQGLNTAAEGTYSTELNVPKFVGNMIRTLLAATGIVFLIITVYAGILYMTAQGDETKVKKAKSMLTSAVIGLIIIVGAYAITRYVVNALAEAATATTTTESAEAG